MHVDWRQLPVRKTRVGNGGQMEEDIPGTVQRVGHRKAAQIALHAAYAFRDERFSGGDLGRAAVRRHQTNHRLASVALGPLTHQETPQIAGPARHERTHRSLLKTRRTGLKVLRSTVRSVVLAR